MRAAVPTRDGEVDAATNGARHRPCCSRSLRVTAATTAPCCRCPVADHMCLMLAGMRARVAVVGPRDGPHMPSIHITSMGARNQYEVSLPPCSLHFAYQMHHSGVAHGVVVLAQDLTEDGQRASRDAIHARRASMQVRFPHLPPSSATDAPLLSRVQRHACSPLSRTSSCRSCSLPPCALECAPPSRCAVGLCAGGNGSE